jgi:ribosomal protein S18 acetylase RimI-like enzyme
VRRRTSQFFKLDEVRFITADEHDIGWIQEQVEDTTINHGSFYVMPVMQRRGIGTQVLQMLLARARNQSKAITLAVVKINPALHFYKKHGFRITHEDKHKFYLRADPTSCVRICGYELPFKASSVTRSNPRPPAV